MTLVKVIHDKNNPYTIVNRTIADDDRISYKAVGIWFYAFSRKEDWKFYLCDLVSRHTDGEHSVKAGIKELETNGYLHKVQRRSKCNKVADGWDWYFFETSKSEEEIKEMFLKGWKSPRQEITPAENQALTIKEREAIKEKNNNNQSKISKPAAAVVVPSDDESKEKLELVKGLKLSKTVLRLVVDSAIDCIANALKIAQKPGNESQEAVFTAALKNGWKSQKTKAEKEAEEAQNLKRLKDEMEFYREKVQKLVDDNPGADQILRVLSGYVEAKLKGGYSLIPLTEMGFEQCKKVIDRI